jgi:hypothetical protein
VTYLRGRGLEPRTLGVTDYDMDAPMTAIRRLMLESNGLITVAFRRTEVRDGKPQIDDYFKRLKTIRNAAEEALQRACST